MPGPRTTTSSRAASSSSSKRTSARPIATTTTTNSYGASSSSSSGINNHHHGSETNAQLPLRRNSIIGVRETVEVMERQQNIVIILTDEERAPPVHEDPRIIQFINQLRGHRFLRKSGVTFHGHHTASIACSPSRATLFTGHYPSLHGVTQTYGGAKEYDDPRLFWLEPDTVPTMGHYFQQAGYDTAYFGKWHISFEDFVDETNHTPALQREDGTIDENVETAYLKKDPLAAFGFNGWFGPEPHGTKRSSTGFQNDPCFAAQAVRWIKDRHNSGNQKPFLLVVSFVNPHDIVYFPYLWLWWGFPVNDGTIPVTEDPYSARDGLTTKPGCQAQYRDKYFQLFAPNIMDSEHRQAYYYMLKMVDQQVDKVLDALNESRFAEETFTVFTSDHGELLGAHGMWQKFYCAYQECLNVPLIISHPRLIQQEISRDFMTSSVDILPTVLGLAGIDVAEVLPKLQKTHSDALPLVGRDHSDIIFKNMLGGGRISHPLVDPDYALYFMIEDHISRGDAQIIMTFKLYPFLKAVLPFNKFDCVQAPYSMEAVIASIADQTWKFVRYWDNPEHWSHPFRFDLYHNLNVVRRIRQGNTTIHRDPYPEEFEMYNLSTDPDEVHNLAHRESPQYADIREELKRILARERTKYRLTRSRPLTEYRKRPLPKVTNVHNSGPLGLMFSTMIAMFIICSSLYGLFSVVDFSSIFVYIIDL